MTEPVPSATVHPETAPLRKPVGPAVARSAIWRQRRRCCALLDVGGDLDVGSGRGGDGDEAGRGVHAPGRAIRRPDDVLEPIYEADPEGRPVVHHRTVDTGKVDGGRGVSTHFSHERPFAALPEKRLLLGALHKAWTELTECWS